MASSDQAPIIFQVSCCCCLAAVVATRRGLGMAQAGCESVLVDYCVVIAATETHF